MPDLVTHTAAAYIASRKGTLFQQRELFFLGTVLPDVLGRPIYILFPKLFFYTIAIHTPVFMLLVTFLLSELFEPAKRKVVIVVVYSGILLHFVLDLFQRHLLTGYYWLFPFSWDSFEIPLFWPEDTLNFIPLWLIIIALMELFSRRRVNALR